MRRYRTLADIIKETSMKRLLLSTIVLAAPALAADPADALKDADRAFAALAREKGPGPAFRSFAAPSVTLFNSAGPPVTPEQLGTRFPAGASFEWAPDEAVISAGGDLGYTIGHATVTMPDQDGTPRTSRQRYITVWRKQPDGSWKFILDGGIPQP